MKTIKIENLIPKPLKEFGFNASEIWEKEYQFFKGEFYQIVAESGVGKSTLINMIYGDRKDYEGNLLFDNKNCKNFTPKDWVNIRRTELSYVFQGLHLFEELTLLENIQLKNQLTKHISINEIKNWIEIVGLENHLNKKAKNLSYGQRQRIAVIRAFCQPFDFILLDEPFSHLDKQNCNLLMDLIETEVKKNNAGIIITTLEKSEDKRLSHVVKL